MPKIIVKSLLDENHVAVTVVAFFIKGEKL